VHASSSPALRRARDRYGLLHDHAKTDSALVRFLVLDSLVASFEPRLLALDQRLDEIQLTLLGSSPPELHDEVVGILRTLTEFVQGLNWYDIDLGISPTVSTNYRLLRRFSVHIGQP
jgi:hypothetical protein